MNSNEEVKKEVPGSKEFNELLNSVTEESDKRLAEVLADPEYALIGIHVKLDIITEQLAALLIDREANYPVDERRIRTWLKKTKK